MLDDFVVRAFVAGIGVAAIAAPVGCFVVWRRMAYFGDTMAHTGLLGVSLGLLLGVSPRVGVLATCIAVALILFLMQRHRHIAADTLLGILSHGTLAFGLVAISFMDWVRVDLLGYLFGDILAVSKMDILWIYAGGAAVLLILARLWRPLIALTINEPMARAEGLPVTATRIAFMLLVAAVIALAMEIIGILLITSLLIIPAAAARRFSRSPEQMAIVSMVFGIVAVCSGLFTSLTWDTPSGPSVVVAATILFAISLLFANAQHIRKSVE